MNNIENIIFDLGGVLLDIDYNLTRTEFEKLGVVHFDELYSQVNAVQLFQKLETGKITEEHFYQEFNHVTGLHLSPEEIKHAWNAMLLSFREKSLEFLDQLWGKYKIYLLSNTNFIHIPVFISIFHQVKRAKTFEEYFDQVFYSCGIGLRKPDLECYQWVIDQTGINPAQTLFIDDSPQNVEAAGLAGLQTIHLPSAKKIEDLGL